MESGIATQDVVSVVVTGKNASSTIDECLRSILSVKYPAERFEVIYVDAESTDGSLEIVKRMATEHQNLRYFVESGLQGAGRNRGIRESRGQIIAFTDTDCVVDESWLDNIVSRLASQPEDVVGVGGPSITPHSESGLARHVGSLWDSFFGSAGARNPAHYSGSRFVDHNPTCNSAYRRWVFDMVGLFNEGLPVTEDEEFDTRVRRQGWRLLYANDVVVRHHRKNTLSSFTRQMYSYGFWRAHSGKKGMVPLKLQHFGPSLLVIYFLCLPFLGSVDLRLSLMPIAAYLAFGIISGTSRALRSRDVFLPTIVLGLGLVEHTAYGLGFISGLIKNGKSKA